MTPPDHPRLPEADARLIERLADLLRDEFYETLEDAAGAGDDYDYESLARRIVQLIREIA